MHDFPLLGCILHNRVLLSFGKRIPRVFDFYEDVGIAAPVGMVKHAQPAITAADICCRRKWRGNLFRREFENKARKDPFRFFFGETPIPPDKKPEVFAKEMEPCGSVVPCVCIGSFLGAGEEALLPDRRTSRSIVMTLDVTKILNCFEDRSGKRSQRCKNVEPAVLSGPCTLLQVFTLHAEEEREKRVRGKTICPVEVVEVVSFDLRPVQEGITTTIYPSTLQPHRCVVVGQHGFVTRTLLQCLRLAGKEVGDGVRTGRSCPSCAASTHGCAPYRITPNRRIASGTLSF